MLSMLSKLNALGHDSCLFGTLVALLLGQLCLLTRFTSLFAVHQPNDGHSCLHAG